ncbi:MAG: MFS transporter [Methylophaga sp.]|nr:MAG: MFS transporter [Methylophaga sp.]
MIFSKFTSLPRATQQYLIVTLSYWAFTLTDGALRMLVVLYFHGLGYSPLEVAMLFLLYEFFGIVTNLLGGWLGSRLGINVTLHLGLMLQLMALTMLLVDPSWLSVTYVMLSQALSGIAKDLNKMSAKSSIKLLVPDAAEDKLYKWVTLLTGSKNTLKGVGFFLGGLLLTLFGFHGAILSLLLVLFAVAIISLLLLDKRLGQTKYKAKFTDIFSKSKAINNLSAARFFLFGSRDVWFVVALPVFLQSQLNWPAIQVGTVLAIWVIVYGIVQAITPKLTGLSQNNIPDGSAVVRWSLLLVTMPLFIAMGLYYSDSVELVLTVGLIIYGVIFAINSAMHSYLIVSYADEAGVSLDIGFYYMANAAGRLVGTIISGWVYQQSGLIACLLVSTVMIVVASMISMLLPKHKRMTS